MPGLLLYLDEDSLARAFIAALRQHGFDFVTAAEARMMGRSDEEHLAYAIQEGRVLYTANVPDFARLHVQYLALGRTHPGIIVRTWQRMPVGMQVRALRRCGELNSPNDLRDRVLYLGDFIDRD